MMWFGVLLVVAAMIDGAARWSSGAKYREVKAIVEQRRLSRQSVSPRMERAVRSVAHYYEPGTAHLLALIVGAIFVIAGLQGN